MSLEIHYNVSGCFREPEDDIGLAKAAVDAGFEGVWMGDHFLPWIDSRPYTHHAFSWFGAMMNEIPDVPVGTSVSCPMLRYRPPLFAQAVATLDNMYPGRFNLGVGVGEALNEAHFLDSWPGWGTRAEMLVEAIELMEKLWTTDGYISYDGDHFEYDDIRLYTSTKGPIPIHWAGWGPKSCQLAGRVADHLLTAAPADMIENQVIPNFEKGLEQSGRELSEVDVTTEFTANVGDQEELVAEIRERGEYLPVDTELDTADPRDIQEVADRELAEMSDTEIANQYNITEDPDEIIEELEAVADAGATRVLVSSNCNDPFRTIDTFESKILPHFD